ncbi:MAG: hypothetical protein ACPGRZ_16310 [Alphaproteobacteria bacterium]
MKRPFLWFAVASFLTIFSGQASFAFQCHPGETGEGAHDDAERIFLILVLETRLDEEFQKLIESERPQSKDAMKPITVRYRVIEDFKGDTNFKPEFLDLLGIGTGYVGFSPGVYYLVSVPKLDPSKEQDKRTDILKGRRIINFCNVIAKNYRLNVAKFRKEINFIRRRYKN